MKSTDSLQIKAKRILKSIWKWTKPQMLLVTTMAGVILGIVVGISLRTLKCPNGVNPDQHSCSITEETIFYIKFPGEMLINLLKMIILPLIMTSLIASLCRMSSETSGKMGGITLAIFIITTLISVTIAGICSLAIKPGSSKNSSSTSGEIESRTLETILDIFRNLCPRNLVEAAFLTAQTLTKLKEVEMDNGTKVNTTVPVVEMNDAMNALGIIAFSMTFGAILSRIGPRASILKDLNDVIMDVILVMVKIILWYSPIGIFFLLVGQMIEIDDLAQLWASLGLFIVTDIVASLIHMFIILPILSAIILRRNPFVYYYHFLQAILTAFATASSGATLGVSFQCVEEKANVDKRISRFVLPLGATVHMDGTAIYEMCSALFLAQLTNTNLDAGKVIVAALMSALAAISSAGIPQGAIINLVMVLGAIGVPTSEISILYATDWLLDRVRTALNVFGDCLTCVVLQKFLTSDLSKLDAAESESKFEFESSDNTFILQDSTLHKT